MSTIIGDKIGYISVALSGRRTARLLERFSEPMGIEKLYCAQAKNRGVVVFSAHIGPYFLIPAILASIGCEVTAVRKLDSALSHMLDRRVDRLNRFGINLALEMVNSYDQLVLLRLLNDLRKRRLVFLMADYPVSVRKNDGHTKFLGYNIVPARGAAWLHKKAGAPIVPIMFRYVDGQKLRLEVLNEIQTDAVCDLSETTQMVYDVLEKRILEAPESWALWLDYHLMVPPGVKN